MAEEEIMLDEESIALEDSDDSVVTDIDVTNIIPFVMDRYQRAEDYRNNDEERWLRSYRNYRGLYGSDVQFTEAEKSRVFIKVTKTKTLAAYGQIVDILFANKKFPITVEAPTLPVSCNPVTAILTLVPPNEAIGDCESAVIPNTVYLAVAGMLLDPTKV